MGRVPLQKCNTFSFVLISVCIDFEKRIANAIKNGVEEAVKARLNSEMEEGVAKTRKPSDDASSEGELFLLLLLIFDAVN